MEFKIPVDELQSIVSKLSNVVKINESDITGMVVIEAGENVKFRATDGYVTIAIGSDACEIISKGKAVLKLRDIKGYINKFIPLMGEYGTENFHFIIDGNGGLIKSKTIFESGNPSYRRLKFEIAETESPAIKPFGEPQLILNSSILKYGINKVLHCVNPGEVRRAMAGLKIVIDDGKIIFAGTNGVKLAEYALDVNAELRHDAVIFRHGFANVLRTVLDDDCQVLMKIEGRHVYMLCNDLYIIGSLIIGETYPNYSPYFKYEKKIVIPRVNFTDNVISVMDVLDPEDNNRLTLNFTDAVLKLKNDRVEVENTFDEPFGANLDVDVNGEYLASILKDFNKGENIEIRFVEGESHLVFKSTEDDKHTALLTVVHRR